MKFNQVVMSEVLMKIDWQNPNLIKTRNVVLLLLSLLSGVRLARVIVIFSLSFLSSPHSLHSVYVSLEAIHTD